MSLDAQIIADIAREGRLPAVLRSQTAPPSAADVQRWRAEMGAATARWLMEFLAIQRKAVEKFGDGVWMATDRAVQQASDQATARYKARRFPAGASIYDVCCGVGGDSLALRQFGAVVAVDSDPAMASMVAENLANRPSANPAAVVCTAAERLTLTGSDNYLHIDPDRRPNQKRTIDPEHCQPGLDVVDRLINAAEGAAVKWAPAAALPDTWQGRCQQEWISHRGSVRQQVAWFGNLAQDSLSEDSLVAGCGCGGRMATRVDRDGNADSFAAEHWHQAVESTVDVCEWIVDIDGAVRAAGLSAAFACEEGLRALGDASGFFTTPQIPDHPLATAYQVLWSGAGDLKQIKRAAVGLDVRLLEIKVRGTEHRPESLRGRLADKKTRNAAAATLLLGRCGGNTYAVIANRRASKQNASV